MNENNQNFENRVRDTSINSFITREENGTHSKLVRWTEIILKDFPNGISRREIAFEITKRFNYKCAASSLSHPVRILQERDLVKELIREMRPEYEVSRHIIKHAMHVNDEDKFSNKQKEKDADNEQKRDQSETDPKV